MANHNGTTNNKIVILLANGFEEEKTVNCLCQLRQAGLPVSLVGLSAGLISGLHGLTVRPDYTLDQIASGQTNRVVIVPGGRQNVSALLADPRVHQLFDITIGNGGFVAAMTTAEPLLAQAGILTASSPAYFVAQGDLEVNDFSGQLINLMSC